MHIWILAYSTQIIPAATKVCAHIYRAIYEISKAQEPSLAHTRGLFLDSVSQMTVQHVPSAMGQGMAWGWHMPPMSLEQGMQDRAGGHYQPSTPLIQGLPQRQKGRGPAPRNCQHWHSRISLFRWVLSQSSTICKEVLMCFASPAESRGSQWTSKAGQWH